MGVRRPGGEVRGALSGAGGLELRLLPGGDRCPARPGQRLLEAALDGGLPLPFGCQTARCGVCRVEVVSAPPDGGLEAPSRLEALTLESYRCPPGVRLACQAVIRGDLVLRSLLPRVEEDD